MGDYIRDLGDDPPPATLESISKQTAEIIERQKEAENARKWSVIIAAASALFAAVKLGIIAIPHLRRRRGHQVGELAPVSNPRRRRRKRLR